MSLFDTFKMNKIHKHMAYVLSEDLNSIVFYLNTCCIEASAINKEDIDNAKHILQEYIKFMKRSYSSKCDSGNFRFINMYKFDPVLFLITTLSVFLNESFGLHYIDHYISLVDWDETSGLYIKNDMCRTYDKLFLNCILYILDNNPNVLSFPEEMKEEALNNLYRDNIPKPIYIY